MIEIRELSVAYPGGTVALDRASLRFERGAFTVLLGASGAGKSTLLRTLNGLVRPSAGAVTTADFGAIDDPGVLHRHRRRTGMIFQQHQLIGRRSALANVLTGRLGHHGTLRSLLPLPRADRLIALACLERVGLLERALERVDRLSGGQQQRVGIARAVAQQPDLMLADEPVASLDPATAVGVLAQLHAICKADRLTAVVSLHQVELARRFADRIVGMAGGRVVFDGGPAELTDFQLGRIYAADAPARPVEAAAAAMIRPPLAAKEVSR